MSIWVPVTVAKTVPGFPSFAPCPRMSAGAVLRCSTSVLMRYFQLTHRPRSARPGSGGVLAQIIQDLLSDPMALWCKWRGYESKKSLPPSSWVNSARSLLAAPRAGSDCGVIKGP